MKQDLLDTIATSGKKNPGNLLYALLSYDAVDCVVQGDLNRSEPACGQILTVAFRRAFYQFFSARGSFFFFLIISK